MEVGYSKRSLADKLGLKSSHKGLLVNPPPNYIQYVEPLPAQVVVEAEVAAGPLDFVHFFTTTRAELEQRFPDLKQKLAYNGLFWVSWPKKASKLKTDVGENLVRAIGLQNNLVDVKICAIDDDWSALKFVYRKADRPHPVPYATNT